MIKGKIRRKTNNYFELNENATYQNLLNACKVVFRWKFRVLISILGKKKGLKSVTSPSTVQRGKKGAIEY
jgi:hypothetical protein